MSQIREIIEGWANVIKDQFDAVDPVTKEVSKRRLELCNGSSVKTRERMFTSHIWI